MDITSVIQKAEAINQLREKESFNGAVTTFARVVNILPKDTNRVILPNSADLPVNQNLFQEEIEGKLFQDYEAIGQQIADLSETGNYQESFDKLHSLKAQVDQFFDQVMVMDKNEDIKNNRLNVLTNLARKIWSIADFSKLVIK